MPETSRIPGATPSRTVHAAGMAGYDAHRGCNSIDKFGGQGVIKSDILAGGRGKGSFGNGFKGGVRLIVSQSTPSAVASASVRSRHWMIIE